MKFKNFEIRECEYNKYEVVKWETNPFTNQPCCYTIAFICYHYEEPKWEFKSVGVQYLRNRVDGLEEWILKYIDLLNISKKYLEKEYND